MKQLCSLYREEIEFYLSKGNTVASFGEAPTTSDKPYMCIQPTRNSFGTPDSRSSTFYRDLISSMGEIQLDRTNTTGAVTGITGSMEPVVELPGPSFLHAFLAKRFNSRNGTNQNVVNGSTTADLIHGTPTTELTNGECRPSPTQSSNADVNTTMLSSSNDQSVVRVVDELDDAEEEDLDDASEESEWSEHIDVEIGWWHRQRRRSRPRRSATAHEAEEQQRIGDTSSAPDVPSAQSITSVRRNSRAQQSRTRRRRLSNTGRYKQRQHQQHGRQRGVSVSVHPSRRSIRQQHRLILRRRILREMRLAETRVERDDQQQLRRSERRLRGCIRRSSRSSLRNNESVPEPIVDSNVVKSMTPSKKPTEETELADLVPVRRERLKRRLIRSMDYALFTASSVPLSAIPPEGYLGPDCEGPVYSPDDSASVLWPGPHFDWVSTLHPTATPYVPQVGDSLVYIVRGHRDYLAQSWQSSELPSLVPAAEHGDSGLVTGTCPAGNLPWLSWPEIPPYTCGVVTEIHYTTVRTITNDSTARIPTSTYRGARAGAAWRRRGIRSEIKHAKTSSKRLPTGSAHVCPSGTSSISTSSIVPSVAFSGDSFVRLVTLRLCVNPKDQPYAHLATTTADCRPNGKLHGAESANVYIDVTYHDVDGVLDFLILRHLFDVAIRRQWKRGDLFICPVGDVWWTGRVLHSPSNFLVNPKAAVCQPSTSSVPVPPKCTKDPWLACFIRWSDSDDAENQTDDKLDLSLLDIADSSYWDTDSRDNLPDNVDRLSPWDMHIPYSNPSASAHSRMCPSQSQIRELYGVPSDSPYGDTQSTCKESHMDKAIRLKKWASRAQTVLACFQEIMKLPASELFNRPVDLVSYPDYLFVNPYPVDLALIVARLTAGFYRQPEAVRSDLQHLVDNAVRYNRTESAVVQHARLVFQLAVRALESNRFKPSQVTKEYERLCRIESDGTQMTSTSLRRSHSRSKSPGLKSESQPSAPQRRPVTDAEDIETTTLAHCETRLYSSPAHHVRHSQRKRQSRSRTDSSSETKTGSAFDVDEENENDPLGPNETNSCSCSFSPSQWVPRCMSLMKQLCSHDRSMFFRESIDTELYPDYKEIVSVPMDLSTVQKRLRSTLDAIHPRYRDLRSRASFGHRRRRPTYTCPHSFVRDLYRIVRNSKLYNDDPETVVYGDTRWLEDWIERMIVTSLQQHGLWSTPETRENKTDSLLHSRWRKTRGRPSGFRARSRLNNRSHVRGPLYKRPRVLTQFPSKKIYPKTQTKGNPTADLPHRTSSGRVVRPPLRNSGTIPYTSSLSSDGGLSDVPEEQRQMPLPQFNVIKRGRRTHLSSTSQRRSETPLRRSKRCCRRIGRHRSKLQSDSDDHGGESDELD
ncbi:hypothetical protein D915_005027 [Fasciola hepatica]|uniref:Bromo domain-containing protein n=1 Tax=Fasciola hepatica TaxID=6192 RepID=A0A4E0RSL4_FASHE|nr:hypothetical protein D915_005027 [Fasciola hepatica]